MTTGARTWTLDEAGDLLGVSTGTVWRIAGIWHPPVGSGRTHPPLTATDIKMVRACLKFHGRPTGTRYTQLPHRDLMIAAHDAIRDNPEATWMLVTAPTVTVYTTAEAATEAWLESGRPVGRLVRIDGGDTDDLGPCPADVLRELRHLQITPSAVVDGTVRLDVLHWGGEAMAHITWRRGDADTPAHWLLTEADTDVIGVPGTLGECLAEVARWDADLQNRHEQETNHHA